MVESFLKGGILLYAKEAIIKSSKAMGASDVSAGLLGGFGGGVAQVSVLGPCTFLVTAIVTGEKGVSTLEIIKKTWNTRGISGFYPGGTALMLRQGSNWASRQGFTEGFRGLIKKYKYNDDNKAKLTVWDEALSGIVGN